MMDSYKNFFLQRDESLVEAEHAGIYTSERGKETGPGRRFAPGRRREADYPTNTPPWNDGSKA